MTTGVLLNYLHRPVHSVAHFEFDLLLVVIALTRSSISVCDKWILAQLNKTAKKKKWLTEPISGSKRKAIPAADGNPFRVMTETHSGSLCEPLLAGLNRKWFPV